MILTRKWPFLETIIFRYHSLNFGVSFFKNIRFSPRQDAPIAATHRPYRSTETGTAPLAMAEVQERRSASGGSKRQKKNVASMSVSSEKLFSHPKFSIPADFHCPSKKVFFEDFPGLVHFILKNARFVSPCFRPYAFLMQQKQGIFWAWHLARISQNRQGVQCKISGTNEVRTNLTFAYFPSWRLRLVFFNRTTIFWEQYDPQNGRFQPRLMDVFLFNEIGFQFRIPKVKHSDLGDFVDWQRCFLAEQWDNTIVAR